MNMHIASDVVAFMSGLPNPDTWTQSLIVEQNLGRSSLTFLCGSVAGFENEIWKPYITNYTANIWLHNPLNSMGVILYDIMKPTTRLTLKEDSCIIANKIRWYTIAHILRYRSISLKAFSNIVSRELTKAGYTPPKKVAKSSFYTPDII